MGVMKRIATARIWNPLLSGDTPKAKAMRLLWRQQEATAAVPRYFTRLRVTALAVRYGAPEATEAENVSDA